MSMKIIDYHNAIGDIYKYQVGIFKFFGFWKLPDGIHKFWQHIYYIHFWHIIIFWVGVLDVAIIRVLLTLNNVREVINIVFIFATLGAVLPKILSVKVKYQQYEALFDVLGTDIFIPRNQYEEIVLKRSLRMIRNLRNIYMLVSFLALNSIMLKNVIFPRKKLPISILVPYSLDQDGIFALTYIYQYFAVAVGCFTNMAFDTLSPALLVFLKTQLDILQHRLRNVGLDTELVKNDAIQLKLKSLIQFFETILKLVETIENLISLPFSIQLFCSILVLVANFYAIASVSSLDDYPVFFGVISYQICMLMQIFLICYFANEVTLSASLLSQEFYCSNWIYWNKCNRKLVLLMMTFFNVPIRIKSINRNYSFNITAFTSIINSSYRYFALLKRINN